jgi:hypothetical protein
MNCLICNRKIDSKELIKCNGCNAGFHYRCVNIPGTVFNEDQAQLKRDFLCDSCLNVTQRKRVTDDTPVRGSRVSMGVKETCDQSFEDVVQSEVGRSLTSDTMFSISSIMDKVNRVILSKMNDLEAKIIKEIKSAVTVLTLENSKLRQELNDVNKKCISYEQEIKMLKTEAEVLNKENGDGRNINNSRGTQKQRVVNSLIQAPTSILSTTVKVGDAEGGTPSMPPLQPLLSQAEQSLSPSYAAVARENAIATNQDTWTEVKRSKKINPIKKGGNTSVVMLKAVERKKFLHLWRLNKCTTEEDLKNYITKLLGEHIDMAIEKLKPRTERDYASFRIGVPESMFEKLCDSDIWPVNVEFSEWIWFRRSTKTNDTKV